MNWSCGNGRRPWEESLAALISTGWNERLLTGFEVTKGLVSRLPRARIWREEFSDKSWRLMRHPKITVIESVSLQEGALVR